MPHSLSRSLSGCVVIPDRPRAFNHDLELSPGLCAGTLPRATPLSAEEVQASSNQSGVNMWTPRMRFRIMIHDEQAEAIQEKLFTWLDDSAKKFPDTTRAVAIKTYALVSKRCFRTRWRLHCFSVIGLLQC